MYKLIFTENFGKVCNQLFSIKKQVFCSFFALKPPCVGLLTTHTTKQKAIEKLKFFLFYGVQGENTIARRQKAKLISIDLNIFNSSPKFSVFKICFLLLVIIGQVKAQKVVLKGECIDYKCLNSTEQGYLQNYLNAIKGRGYNINIFIYPRANDIHSISGLKWSQLPSDLTQSSTNTVLDFLISTGPGYWSIRGNPQKQEISGTSEIDEKSKLPYSHAALCEAILLIEHIKVKVPAFQAATLNLDYTTFVPVSLIDCGTPNKAYSLDNDKFRYPYDEVLNTTTSIKAIYDNAEIKEDRYTLKSEFATDIVYAMPIVTANELNADAKKRWLEAVGGQGIVVGLGSNKTELGKVTAIGKRTKAIVIDDNTVPKERGYPAFKDLDYPKLEEVKEAINSNIKGNQVSAYHTGNKKLIYILSGFENKNDSKKESSGSIQVFQGKSEEYQKWDIDSSIPDTDAVFKDESGNSVGGYNYAKLSKLEVAKLLLGIKKSNNSPYAFEIITSSDKVAGSKEKARTAFESAYANVPNSNPTKAYAGRIWLHEEKESNATSSWSTSTRFNPAAFPTSIDDNTLSIFSKDAADIAASVMGNASYHGTNPKLPGEDFMIDVLNGLKKAFTCSLDPANAQVVWEIPRIRKKKDNSFPNSYEIMVDFMTILGETLGSSISLPDRVWLPDSKQQEHNYCVIDMGGGVAGIFNGVAQGTVTAIQLSSGASGFKQALFISAIVKAFATGDGEMLKALRYPIYGMVNAYKGYLIQLANPCTECCEEKTNASIGLIVNFVTDIISGSFVDELIKGKSVKKFATDCQTTAQNYKHPDVFMQKMKADAEKNVEDVGKSIERFHQKIIDWINGKGLNAEQVDHWKKDAQHNPSIEAININPHNLGLPVETVHRALEAINEAGMTPKELADYKKIIETDFVGSQKEANFKAFLEAMAVSLSPNLQTKLGAAGAGKLKMWAYKKGKAGGVTYKTKDGTIKTGADAVAQIHADLEAGIGAKNVVEVFIDQHERLVHITDVTQIGQTRAVIIEITATGEYKTFEYKAGYTKGGVSGYPPLSKNGLAPDFSSNPKGAWLHPESHNIVIEIEMSSSRTTDYSRANAELSSQNPNFTHSGTTPPTGYTWHHLDDFNPKTGKCTMQLVKFDVHNSTKPHTGSVKQYENYHDTTYK